MDTSSALLPSIERAEGSVSRRRVPSDEDIEEQLDELIRDPDRDLTDTQVSIISNHQTSKLTEDNFERELFGDRSQPLETVATQNPLETVATQNPLETVATQNPLVTVATQNPLVTVATQNPLETVATQNPLETVATQNPLETVATQNPPPPVVTQEPGLASNNAANKENIAVPSKKVFDFTPSCFTGVSIAKAE